MEPQQLSAKVATLEGKVAVLEDEGKILKGEIKQVLTEIRSAVLGRDNPFEDAGRAQPAANIAPTAPPTVQFVTPVVEHEVEQPHERPATQPSRREPEAPVYEDKEPIMLRPEPVTIHALPAPQQPQWTLLTIASLSAWGEEAMRRLGALRMEILLDLCEAAGHLSPEARAALSRVKELDIPAPEQAPSTNETVVMLRQLDALLNDDYQEQRRAA